MRQSFIMNENQKRADSSSSFSNFSLLNPKRLSIRLAVGVGKKGDSSLFWKLGENLKGDVVNPDVPNTCIVPPLVTLGDARKPTGDARKPDGE